MKKTRTIAIDINNKTRDKVDARRWFDE